MAKHLWMRILIEYVANQLNNCPFAWNHPFLVSADQRPELIHGGSKSGMCFVLSVFPLVSTIAKHSANSRFSDPQTNVRHSAPLTISCDQVAADHGWLATVSRLKPLRLRTPGWFQCASAATDVQNTATLYILADSYSSRAYPWLCVRQHAPVGFSNVLKYVYNIKTYLEQVIAQRFAVAPESHQHK